MGLLCKSSLRRRGFHHFHQKQSLGGAQKKKVFLKISQNSQKNNCARVSFLTKSLATFLRTPIFIEHACWLLLPRCGSCYSFQKPKQKFKDWDICSRSVTKYKITVSLFLFCYFSKSKIYWHSELHLKRVRTLKFTQCIESLNVGHLKRRKVKWWITFEEQ